MLLNASEYIPSSTAEEGFSSCPFTFDGPSTATIQCTMINRTFVHKNQLTGIICTDVSCEIGMLLGIALDHSVRQLSYIITSHENSSLVSAVGDRPSS